MEKLLIKGGKSLSGKISCSGAKNAALPMIAATILCDDKVVLKNLPYLQDITTMFELLGSMGSEILLDENKSNDDLFQSFEEYCKNFKENINNEKLNIIKKSLTFLKNKAKTMEDIYNNSKFIINDEIIIEKAEMSLLTENAKNIIKSFMKKVNEIEVFNKETLEPIINNLISENQTNFKGVGQPLRIILTGSKFGPGIYDIIISLGKKRVLDRLSKIG